MWRGCEARLSLDGAVFVDPRSPPLSSPPPPWPTWVAHCSGWSEVVVLFPPPRFGCSCDALSRELDSQRIHEEQQRPCCCVQPRHGAVAVCDTNSQAGRGMCGWARGPCSRSRLLSALLFFFYFFCYHSQFSILSTMVHGRWCSNATLCVD